MARSSAAAALREPPALQHLKRGMDLHGRGDLAGAEALYRSALSCDRRQVFALHLLGVVCSQTGRLPEALGLFDRAIALDPNWPDALFMRATALANLGRHEEAIIGYDRALALRPDHPESWNNRGSALTEMKRYEPALASFDRALALKPDYVDALNNRALVLNELERYAEALEGFEATLARDPAHAGALAHRAAALGAFRRFDEALLSVERALTLEPGRIDALLQRGNTLGKAGRIEEALAAFDLLLTVAPDHKEGWTNRAVVLSRLDRYADSMASFNRALALAPNCPEVLLHRAGTALLQGDFAAGWRDYAARWKTARAQRPYFDGAAPEWRGEPLAGKRVVVYEEQGAGDVLQFCRYVSLLAAAGADVTLLVRESLVGLLRSLPVAVCEAADQTRTFDYKCALMDLPLLCRTELATIPADVPYLRADPLRTQAWRERLGSEGFKIGIVWSASEKGTTQGRSATLAEFVGLARIPGVRLVSLQKNAGVEQLGALASDVGVETLGEAYESGDFLETASAMESLDLIIAVDTSVAHLAGALGRPCWVALPHLADWRWLLDRLDSPWYPTLRLFRQQVMYEWRDVFADMETALWERVAS